MNTTPEPICLDCDAERVVTECTVGGRPGGRLVETIHAATCPTYRGIV